MATTDASVLIPASLNMEAFTITIYETVKKLVKAASNSFFMVVL
ncbi:Xanthine/uracil permease [Bacillus cereus Rock3-29]|nr:Xanthine/uracil permease [Bacillus cereus Rock3-29]